MEMPEKYLVDVLFRSWWVILLRGIIAIAFGVLSWVWPQISLATLILLFGIYAFADGVLGIWTAAATYKKNESWWVVLLWGLVGIGVGIITLLEPGITALALLFYIAIWAIATGILEIVAAIRLRVEVEGEWLLILSGIASAIFGIMLIAWPGAGALALIWLIGTYAILFGVLISVLAFRIRSIGRNLS